MKKLLGAVLAMGLLSFASPSTLLAEEAEATTTPNIVPVIVLSGPIAETKNPMELFGNQGTTLGSLRDRLEQAAADPNVAAVHVRFESPAWGLSQAMDFHGALTEFKASGKKLYASYDSAGLGTYVVSTAADEIVIPPVSVLELLGINATLFYYKGLLEKLGIEGDGVNTGKFKDAFDPFIKDKMGDGTRIQISALIEDLFGECVRTVAANRGISEEEAFELLTLGPYTAKSALAAGAVDRVANLNDFEAALDSEYGIELDFDKEYAAAKKKKEKLDFMSLFMGSFGTADEASDAEPKIAVVYATGAITDGRLDKSNPFASQEGIASDDFIDLLDEVMEEEGLEALVLRVNSPGGSAIASDRIWKRLEEIQAAGVPVVVSMSSVAASGGYYISMGADRIFAEPTTITGSIGVVGGKFAMGGLYKKLGVTRESLAIGDHVGIYNESRPWNEKEREILMEMLDEIYDVFTSKVADGRGMTQDRVKELGGGRVWSGIDALDNGLVDELGGLHDAIASARTIADAGDAKVVHFPKEVTFMEFIEKALAGEVSIPANFGAFTGNPAWQAAAAVIPEKHLRHLAFMVDSMKDRHTVMLVMPALIDIH